MNATNESIKHDLRKDPRELEREADSARADLEHTLEALEERLAPGALVEQVIRAVRHNGGEFSTNLATQVRNNPVPTLLVSAGLTWLMAASKHAPERRFDGNGGASIRSSMSAVGDRTSAAAGSARDAAHRVSERARGAAGAVRGAGSRALASTRSGAHDLREGWSHMNREHPLVLGALAVAAGAAMAAWLPSTQREDEWIGDASDDAKSRAGDEVKRRAGEAREAVEDAADSVRQRVESRDAESRHSGTGERTVERTGDREDERPAARRW